MLCEADRRMTCEQLKAHPVRPFTLRLIGADGSSSTESIGLQSEISTLHSFHTLNPLPILHTSQLMRLIRRMIYLLERRMGTMQRRIWLSWVIRMSLVFSCFLFPFASFLLPHLSFVRVVVLRRLLSRFHMFEERGIILGS
jgi:hypothetical protein